MSRIERRLDAVTKLLQTGMKMLVQMQEEHREIRRENREAQRENREAQRENREAIRALIEAQMRTDAKLDRLISALLRARPNGR